MAILTFNQYLEELGGAAQDLQNARNRLEALLSRHNSAARDTLTDADFLNATVTRAQYDALMVTVNDLVNVWWIAGHGTNIENYLVD